MPRVSIALAVYNGERYLGQQVESLLAQTFTDFELLLLDNASTDRTQEICRAFAARDARVRYHRNDRNIGGGPNQNLAFDLAAPAPYFKWAAHDDVHAPRFLERCVEALDRDPSAVLAFSQADFIDSDGKPTGRRLLELPLGSPDLLVRFEALLQSYDCMEMFSVMRRSALVGKPIGLYSDGDGVLLTRLALIGRFIEVPEVLFYNRRHAEQAGSVYERNNREWAVWWDPKNAGKRVFPVWRRNVEMWKAVLNASLPTSDRLRCLRALAQWTRWRRHRLYDDVAFHLKDILRSAGRDKSGGAERVPR